MKCKNILEKIVINREIIENLENTSNFTLDYEGAVILNIQENIEVELEGKLQKLCKCKWHHATIFA